MKNRTINNAHASIWIGPKNDETHDYEGQDFGGYSNATHALHSVSVHDVKNITRKTKTLKDSNGDDFKVTTITLETSTGPVEINCYA